MSKEVVISTSRLNCYGFRVLTEGIDLEQYKKNPVLLWMHTRPLRGTTDEVLPLGRVENLRVDGDRLIGTPVFDMEDEFAKKVAGKWEQGILKMVSAGIVVLEESKAPEHIVEGQRYATVTKSKLQEVSIVDIGANDDALVLYRDDEPVNLKCGDELVKTLSLVQGKGDPIINKNTDNMKQIAKKLGLAETATADEIVAAIDGLQTENKTLKAEQKSSVEKSLKLVVDQAVKDGRITADKKEHFVEMGRKVGLESLAETLKLMGGAVRPTDILKEESSGAWKTLRDVPVEELETLRNEQPSEYVKLYKAEYGVVPAM